MSQIVHLPPYHVDAVAHAVPSSGIDWHLSGYGIPSLWAKTQGEGVQVAVLDTGVCEAHPVFYGAGLMHRNFTKDCSPFDTNGHGTHVAGIVAGRGPMMGVAPKADILSLKVLGNDGAGSMDAVARALYFAVEIGCHVVVMSLGAPVGSSHLEKAVLAASKAGVPVVCAAGNDGGRVSYPAAYGYTIAVGAVDERGQVCEFSCRGREVDVAAPGHKIRSAWCHGGYATLSGTSMAAPFVAGVLALATANCGGRPLGLQARAIIAQTSTDAGPPGKDNDYGWGLISPASMLQEGVCKIL
jgi:subtilisin family serine protease